MLRTRRSTIISRPKNKLFEAVIQRGATVSTQKRTDRLTDELATNSAVRLEQIMRILFEPYCLAADQVPKREREFNRFTAQFGCGTSPEAQAITLAAFDGMARHFIQDAGGGI